MAAQIQRHTAVVLEALGKPLVVKQLPIPPAVAGSAVVRILASQVSPNAKAVFGGQFPLKPGFFPVTPHAPSIGRIHAAGPDATSLKPGQLVFTDMYTPSRDDPDASVLLGYMGGIPELESNWTHGTYAEYAQLPLERIFALDEKLLVEKLKYTPADLTFLGTLGISFGGLLRGETTIGDSVVIAPATGNFGSAAVHAAIGLGARVVACGRNESTLHQLSEAFAESGRLSTVVMTGDEEKDTAAIKAANGGKPLDKYVDFVPPQAAGTKHFAACIKSLRRFGTAIFMGVTFAPVDIPYVYIMHNCIKIQGSFMFDRPHAEKAISLLENGLLNVGDRLNSRIKVQSFKLQDFEKAFEAAAAARGFGQAVVLEP